VNIPLTSPSISLSMDDGVDDDEIGGTAIITKQIEIALTTYPYNCHYESGLILDTLILKTLQ